MPDRGQPAAVSATAGRSGLLRQMSSIDQIEHATGEELPGRKSPPLPPPHAKLPAPRSSPPAMDLAGYQALVWSLSGALLAFFTGFALIYTFLRRRRHQEIKYDQEEFITARRQVGAAPRPARRPGCRPASLPRSAHQNMH